MAISFNSSARLTTFWGVCKVKFVALEKIIAESSAMKKTMQEIEKIARSHASIFLMGETGTGKEVIAKNIHALSERAGNAFIKVNCAAIPEPLIESEFFGHERGAFTGAMNRRLGRFELAHKGTLLLDEISEIPLGLQAKLLRVLQEQEFERVGGSESIRVDVRIISTSNRNMKETVAKKLFREDLYYRLNVVPIKLSPLRERFEDILPLAEYFLERLAEENQKPRVYLSAASKQRLLDYPWPGNIRELANVIERTVVMHSAATIEPEHLNLDPYPSCALPVGITLQELEKKYILDTLALQSGNRTKTAEVLGISTRTLRNKLHQYQIN